MSDTVEKLIRECGIPSPDCDRRVLKYCQANKSNQDFCGCAASNVLTETTDPAIGNLPVKCWAKSCTQNPNAYQFFAYQADPCPNVCIDNSTITALGSNITDSTFTQAGCGAQVNTDGSTKKTLADLYAKGILVTFGFTGVLFLLFLSMSILSSISL